MTADPRDVFFSKLWIVPERVAFEEVLEQVMRGAIVSRRLTTEEFVEGL